MRQFERVNSYGFALIEFIVAFGLVMSFALLIMNYSTIQDQLLVGVKTTSAQDRIVAGVRSLAGNTAALRNSMRALSADGSGAANPKLLACAGGNPMDDCDSLKDIPLTLYSPLLTKSPTGEILGVQAISAPTGSTQPLRFNIAGMPCASTDTSCPLWVFTSFKALCGPAAQDPSVTVTQTQLASQTHCSIADLIEVTYTVQLDPAEVAANPSLASLAQNTVSGSVVTRVVDISGNMPK